MTTPTEIWRLIDGCGGAYSVSNLGRVRSEPRTIINRGVLNKISGRILKATPAKSHGYPVVNIKRFGKQRPHLVHRLVAETFIGPCPPGMECAHADGDRANARLSNLRWDTHSNNNWERAAHGTLPRGENMPLAKLTDSDIRSILKDDRSQTAIAKGLGVHPSLISRVKSREIWAHVDA